MRLRRGSCLPGIIGMSAVACESFQRKWYLFVGYSLADGVRRLSLGGISGIGKIPAVVDGLSGNQKGRQSRRLTALVFSRGAAYRIRTCDVLIRSQTLYPAEVTPHCKGRVCLNGEASSTIKTCSTQFERIWRQCHMGIASRRGLRFVSSRCDSLHEVPMPVYVRQIQNPW